MNGTIRIGTSGWHYAHWYGTFYPHTVRKSRMLEYYRQKFNTVEINNSFYRLPDKKTFAAWKDTAGPGFCFAVKAGRYITHMKKLKDAAAPLSAFLENAAAQEENMGPELFQLPPRWKINPDRLREFLRLLPGGVRSAFEFRDQSWFENEVYSALHAFNAAFCIYQLGGLASPREVTADFVYIRLHGPGGKYRGSYDTRTLEDWAQAVGTWCAQGKDVYCYFDTDQAGYAAQNALTLQVMLR
ncbi:MAG: DUF72 domain-containing protein [Spirochaetia bacterium]